LIPYTRAALVVALALSGMSGCSALSDEDSGVLLQDDFSDPDSGWPRDSDREATLEYADEAYRILVKDPGNAQSSVFEVSKANTWGWSSAEVVILIVAAVLVLIAFVAYERSGAEPLIDMHLLARRPAWSANLVAFAMGFALFSAGIVVPQIATLPSVSGSGIGLTYTQTGLVLLPGALAIVVGGWTAGVLVGRIGARTVVAVGALAAAIGYVPVGLGIGLAFAAWTTAARRRSLRRQQ
jgi:hypothetical protein